jgi:hypothetical protein
MLGSLMNNSSWGESLCNMDGHIKEESGIWQPFILISLVFQGKTSEVLN